MKDSSSTPTNLFAAQKEKLKDGLKLEKPSIDLKAAAVSGINLLWKLFPYERHTFLYKKGTSCPVRTYTDKNAALAAAYAMNLKGYDVYFMVNPGDGVVHETKKTPRSGASVVTLNNCFMDTDNCPIEAVMGYLEDRTAIPQLIIESSPGRFHLYFFLTETEKTPENIAKWNAIQHMIHRLGDATIKNPSQTLGTDNTMADISKVLRVPGFTHIEKEHLVSVYKEFEILPYDLNELFTITDAQRYLDYSRETYGTSRVPDSTRVLPPGERYQALQSLSLSLANNDKLTEDQKFNTYSTFVLNNIDHTDKVYAFNGILTPKSLSLFESANKKVTAEQIIKTKLLTTSIDTRETTPPSPWHLPDSFYLSAPNGFGDVVKQVMNYSVYPNAALAFGTFLTGLSILRSKQTLTPHGSSPALYTLNVAIAGYGKSDPMTLLQNMFVSTGLGSLIDNEIRSDRGIYEHLSSNDGYGLFLLDEVAPLFKAIQKDDAQTHHANISKALLYLYSASAMKGVSFGKVAKKAKETAIVINNPMLSLCAFTVPHEFNRLFTSESVAKGLFQRLIPIVPQIVDTPMNPNADKEAIIRSPLFESFTDAQELDDEGNPVAPLMAAQRGKAVYEEDAQEAFTALAARYRTLMVEAALDDDKAHMSGLYSRIAEQTERVATVLTPHGEMITLATFEYAQKFIESRHDATMAVAGSTVLRGKGSDAMEREGVIEKAISRVCMELDVPVVIKSTLFDRVRRHFKDADDYSRCLTHMAEMGRIEVVKNYKPQGSRRSATGVKLADVLPS